MNDLAEEFKEEIKNKVKNEFAENIKDTIKKKAVELIAKKSGFLLDGKGNKSSNRLMSVCSVATIIDVWAYLSITTGVFQEFNNSSMVTLGIMMGSKQVSKYLEKDKDEL